MPHFSLSARAPEDPGVGASSRTPADSWVSRAAYCCLRRLAGLQGPAMWGHSEFTQSQLVRPFLVSQTKTRAFSLFPQRGCVWLAGWQRGLWSSLPSALQVLTRMRL